MREINFYLSDEEYEFDIRNIYRIFDLNNKLKFNYEDKIDKNDFLSILLEDKNIKTEEGFARVVLMEKGKIFCEKSGFLKDIVIEKKDAKKSRKTLVKKLIYDVLSAYYNYDSLYGILTGIRPGKLITQAYNSGFTREETEKIMKDTYGVSDEKFQLLDGVHHIQSKYIGECNASYYNLYIGVPFCPTRCTYCSFVSFAKYEENSVNQYVEVLKHDIEETIKMAKEKGLKLHTIYFGGGTPSVLSIDNINDIFSLIEKLENLDQVAEINFEAGRADTITEELLLCLKDLGVDRICINPQTMNQKTLDLVKRNHTVEDVYKAYDMARKIGFDSINMDLIIGLPGESKTDVENTMKAIMKMNPENITVHTLAYKKGSKLFNMMKALPDNNDSLIEISDISKNYCIENNYMAYYMYRQKKIKDNLENVGYCKKGKESIYNIVIIEEIETILACGVGAASKILQGDNKHQRISNYKNLDDYMEKIERNLQDKRSILLAEG